MNYGDQGYSGYYDATIDVDATVGMGELGPGSWAKADLTSDPAPLGDVNVRSGSGTQYPVIGGVEKGGTVQVLDVSDDGAWIQVQWNGGLRRPAVSGWSAAKFFSEADAPAFGPPPPPAPSPTPVLPSIPGVPGPTPSAPSSPARPVVAKTTGPDVKKLGIAALALAALGYGVYKLAK